MGFWPGLKYQLCISSCGAGLTSSQKVTGYSHSSHPTITPRVPFALLVSIVACRALTVQGHRCPVSPSVLYSSSSCSMRASRQGSSYVSSGFVSVCPAAKCVVSLALRPYYVVVVVAMVSHYKGNDSDLCCLGDQKVTRWKTYHTWN